MVDFRAKVNKLMNVNKITKTEKKRNANTNTDNQNQSLDLTRDERIAVGIPTPSDFSAGIEAPTPTLSSSSSTPSPPLPPTRAPTMRRKSSIFSISTIFKRRPKKTGPETQAPPPPRAQIRVDSIASIESMYAVAYASASPAASHPASLSSSYPHTGAGAASDSISPTAQPQRPTSSASSASSLISALSVGEDTEERELEQEKLDRDTSMDRRSRKRTDVEQYKALAPNPFNSNPFNSKPVNANSINPVSPIEPIDPIETIDPVTSSKHTQRQFLHKEVCATCHRPFPSRPSYAVSLPDAREISRTLSLSSESSESLALWREQREKNARVRRVRRESEERDSLRRWGGRMGRRGAGSFMDTESVNEEREMEEEGDREARESQDGRESIARSGKEVQGIEGELMKELKRKLTNRTTERSSLDQRVGRRNTTT
ncbi:hypothetical protein P280DRAFT_482593 [Massarina eburnea CBS 473.64]|uniref:Uncharacterized protein n=1 Tax=Massarina eburnea CBS 473.64 TaxID=1395130 RepID=A0A6A6RQI3_9PLEO|nr:hypothetical protein P280DRAFT_482593 [Massarina eburnea CBS 473.64]